VDPENNRPITYLVSVAADAALLPAGAPISVSTTNTNASIALNSGVWFVTVRAADAFTNISAYTGFSVSVTVLETVSELDRVYFYPNPVRRGETVHLNNFTDDALVRVFNVRGDLILETAERNFVLPDHLAAGVYFVVIRDDAARKVKKLIYLR
jgi:hypothetical protein